MRYTKAIWQDDEPASERGALLRRYKAFLKVEEGRIHLRHKQSTE